MCARGEITSHYRHIEPLEIAAREGSEPLERNRGKRRWMKSRYMHKEPLEREREREPLERARARG